MNQLLFKAHWTRFSQAFHILPTDSILPLVVSINKIYISIYIPFTLLIIFIKRIGLLVSKIQRSREWNILYPRVSHELRQQREKFRPFLCDKAHYCNAIVISIFAWINYQRRPKRQLRENYSDKKAHSAGAQSASSLIKIALWRVRYYSRGGTTPDVTDTQSKVSVFRIETKLHYTRSVAGLSLRDYATFPPSQCQPLSLSFYAAQNRRRNAVFPRAPATVCFRQLAACINHVVAEVWRSSGSRLSSVNPASSYRRVFGLLSACLAVVLSACSLLLVCKSLLWISLRQGFNNLWWNKFAGRATPVSPSGLIEFWIKKIARRTS